MPGTATGTVCDEDEPNRSFSGMVVDQTDVDDVVLGAPLAGEDSSTSNEMPHLPAGGPAFTELLHPRITAGCAWDKANWSCAYDAVFMSFWSIYKKSSPGWRDKWRQQAPKWNDFFGAAYNSLLVAAQGEEISQASLSRKFTSFRETFRDELHQVNPDCFKRYGAVEASVCRILGHIFSSHVEREPYLDQVAACDPCGTSAHYRCCFSLIGSSQLLDGYLNEDDTEEHLPLQVAVTRYIQRNSQEPLHNRCPTCSGPLRVESLSVPEMTWLWIEILDPTPLITPSLRLVFGPQNQRRVYTLQAVIYHGGNHFTARLLDRSATWWKYDGIQRFGVPHIDHIEDEVDLLKSDGRRAAFLLYCRADIQD